MGDTTEQRIERLKQQLFILHHVIRPDQCRLVARWCLAFVLAALCLPFVIASHCRAAEPTRADLARKILNSDCIELATKHISGVEDGATAKLNIAGTAEGRKAKRSKYENAPGGEVELDERLLKGMLELASHYQYRVSEIAGGSHSKNSRHYAGLAIDVTRIDGTDVSKKHPKVTEFMQKARHLGANEVLGPGDTGHDHHIHIAWPRR